MTRILIVGAGFVGLSTARRVRKLLPEANVTLLDSKDRFLFTPRLIDALEDPNYPTTSLRADIRALAKRDGFTFIQGRAERVEQEAKTLFYTPPTSRDREEAIAYDILVLCHGAQPCFYGIPGVAEHSFPLKIEEDVHHVHDRVRALLEQANKALTDEARKQLLTFVTVGAGPSGVEAIGALKRYVEKRCDESYTSLKPHLSWTLVQGGPQILPGFPLALVQGAQKILEREGIAVRVATNVTGMNAHEIATAQGSIPASFVLWTAGIEACPLTLIPEVHTERGGYLSVDQHFVIGPGIFGAGDVVMYREGNVVIPKNAQTAMRMAEVLAENLVRCVRKQALLPFHYKAKGNIVTVGDTGFLDLKFAVFQTRLTRFIRQMFYRIRFWQMTGM